MKNTAKSPTLCIATLGCKVNKADTELMQQALTAQGYELVPFEHGADVYIINTCTVTAKSDYQSRQLVRRALRQNSQAQIVVTGCYAQTNPAEIKQIPGVSLILNNQDKASVGKFIKNPLVSSEKQSSANFKSLDAPVNTSYYTRAFVKIQDGCNWACTYCIVPQARGRSRSRPLPEIIRQANQLITQGYKEIVLTGIHIGHYGLDLSPKNDLADLVVELSCLEGLGRIRLSSLEPTEFSPALIKTIQNNDKICHHFHIPLQSADNNILKAMGRRYKFEQYQELIQHLHELFPRAALGADVIVGFPGENEASFQITYQRVAQLPLTYLHVFSYSKRPNTRAAELPQQVTAQDKKSRSARLRKLGEEKKLSFYKNQLQQTRPGLMLNQRHSESGHLIGLSDNYINILTDANDDLINKLIPLQITKVTEGKVFGKLAKGESP